MPSAPRLAAGTFTSTTDWYAARSDAVLGSCAGTMLVDGIPVEARAASSVAASPAVCCTINTRGGPTTWTSASPTLFSAYVSRTGSIAIRRLWNPVADGLKVWERLVSPLTRSTCAVLTSVLSTYHRTVAVVATLLTITAWAAACSPWLIVLGASSRSTRASEPTGTERATASTRTPSACSKRASAMASPRLARPSLTITM